MIARFFGVYWGDRFLLGISTVCCSVTTPYIIVRRRLWTRTLQAVPVLGTYYRSIFALFAYCADRFLQEESTCVTSPGGRYMMVRPRPQYGFPVLDLYYRSIFVLFAYCRDRFLQEESISVMTPRGRYMMVRRRLRPQNLRAVPVLGIYDRSIFALFAYCGEFLQE